MACTYIYVLCLVARHLRYYALFTTAVTKKLFVIKKFIFFFFFFFSLSSKHTSTAHNSSCAVFIQFERWKHVIFTWSKIIIMDIVMRGLIDLLFKWLKVIYASKWVLFPFFFYFYFIPFFFVFIKRSTLSLRLRLRLRSGRHINLSYCQFLFFFLPFIPLHDFRKWT